MPPRPGRDAHGIKRVFAAARAVLARRWPHSSSSQYRATVLGVQAWARPSGLHSSWRRSSAAESRIDGHRFVAVQRTRLMPWWYCGGGPRPRCGGAQGSVSHSPGQGQNTDWPLPWACPAPATGLVGARLLLTPRWPASRQATPGCSQPRRCAATAAPCVPTAPARCGKPRCESGWPAPVSRHRRYPRQAERAQLQPGQQAPERPHERGTGGACWPRPDTA